LHSPVSFFKRRRAGGFLARLDAGRGQGDRAENHTTKPIFYEVWESRYSLPSIGQPFPVRHSVSALSQFIVKQRTRWHRRGIDPVHGLRRRLAYYVAAHGFEIGDYSIGEPTVRLYNRSKLKVGKYCSIAVGATFIMGGVHQTDAVSTSLFGLPGGLGPSVPDIVIGSDAWLAGNTVVLSGVTIGDGAVVGAGSVVINDVPPYGVVFGNPARLMRKRFSDEIVAELMNLRWWDFPAEQVHARRSLLQDTDVRLAINEFRSLKGLPPWRPTLETPATVDPEGDRPKQPQRAEEICRWCIARLAQLLEIAPERIDPTTRIARLGIDSQQMLTFVFDIEEWLGLELAPTIVHERPTVQALAAYLADCAADKVGTWAASSAEFAYAGRGAV
jgi:virginiamycin A acetyltransferase